MRNYGLFLLEENYGKLPYCFFFSSKDSQTILNSEDLPKDEDVFLIVEKKLDEGVFRVIHVEDTFQKIEAWLSDVKAENIRYVNNVYLKTVKGIEQFYKLKGEIFCLKILQV